MSLQTILKQAKKFVKLIDAEIANGIFEYEKHFPHGAKIERFAPKRGADGKALLHMGTMVKRSGVSEKNL